MLFFLKKAIFRWTVENIVGQRVEKELRTAWKNHKAKKQAKKDRQTKNKQ